LDISNNQRFAGLEQEPRIFFPSNASYDKVSEKSLCVSKAYCSGTGFVAFLTWL
jgi:hypothetical protein